MIDPLSVTEVCELLGVSRQRLYVLRGREDFPQPIKREPHALWDRRAIEEFSERRQPPGRPPAITRRGEETSERRRLRAQAAARTP